MNDNSTNSHRAIAPSHSTDTATADEATARRLAERRQRRQRKPKKRLNLDGIRIVARPDQVQEVDPVLNRSSLRVGSDAVDVLGGLNFEWNLSQDPVLLGELQRDVDGEQQQVEKEQQQQQQQQQEAAQGLQLQVEEQQPGNELLQQEASDKILGNTAQQEQGLEQQQERAQEPQVEEQKPGNEILQQQVPDTTFGNTAEKEQLLLRQQFHPPQPELPKKTSGNAASEEQPPQHFANTNSAAVAGSAASNDDDDDDDDDDRSSGSEDEVSAVPTTTTQTIHNDSNSKPRTKVILSTAAKQERWDANFAALLQYKADNNGSCAVQAVYPANPTLGHWVRQMRARKSRLSNQQIQALEEVGFIWNVRGVSGTWNANYEKLQDYHKKWGHVWVPVNFPADQSFSAWVHCQRNTFASAPKDRQQKLLALGVVPRKSQQKKFLATQVAVDENVLEASAAADATTTVHEQQQQQQQRPTHNADHTTATSHQPQRQQESKHPLLETQPPQPQRSSNADSDSGSLGSGNDVPAPPTTSKAATVATTNASSGSSASTTNNNTHNASIEATATPTRGGTRVAYSKDKSDGSSNNDNIANNGSADFDHYDNENDDSDEDNDVMLIDLKAPSTQQQRQPPLASVGLGTWDSGSDDDDDSGAAESSVQPAKAHVLQTYYYDYDETSHSSEGSTSSSDRSMNGSTWDEGSFLDQIERDIHKQEELHVLQEIEDDIQKHNDIVNKEKQQQQDHQQQQQQEEERREQPMQSKEDDAQKQQRQAQHPVDEREGDQFSQPIDDDGQRHSVQQQEEEPLHEEAEDAQKKLPSETKARGGLPRPQQPSRKVTATSPPPASDEQESVQSPPQEATNTSRLPPQEATKTSRLPPQEAAQASQPLLRKLGSESLPILLDSSSDEEPEHRAPAAVASRGSQKRQSIPQVPKPTIVHATKLVPKYLGGGGDPTQTAQKPFLTPDIMETRILAPFVIKNCKSLSATSGNPNLEKDIDVKLLAVPNDPFSYELSVRGRKILVEGFRLYFEQWMDKQWMQQAFQDLLVDRNRVELDMMLPRAIFLTAWKRGSIEEVSVHNSSLGLWIDFSERRSKIPYGKILLEPLLGKESINKPSLAAAILQVEGVEYSSRAEWLQVRERFSQLGTNTIQVTLCVGGHGALGSIDDSKIVGDVRRFDNATLPPTEIQVDGVGSEMDLSSLNQSVTMQAASRRSSSPSTGGRRIQRPAYNTNRQFCAKFKSVYDIEYQRSDIEYQHAMSEMWNQHKARYGAAMCDDDCPCAVDLGFLTETVVETFISKKIRRDPEWHAPAELCGSRGSPVGFVNHFGELSFIEGYCVLRPRYFITGAYCFIHCFFLLLPLPSREICAPRGRRVSRRETDKNIRTIEEDVGVACQSTKVQHVLWREL